MLFCVRAVPPPLRSDTAATLLGLVGGLCSDMLLVVPDEEVVVVVDELDVEVLLDEVLPEELEELSVVEDFSAWA